MTVSDYYYYLNYKNNLELFYEQNLLRFTITEKIKICKELEWLEKLLQPKKNIA